MFPALQSDSKLLITAPLGRQWTNRGNVTRKFTIYQTEGKTCGNLSLANDGRLSTNVENAKLTTRNRVCNVKRCVRR